MIVYLTVEEIEIIRLSLITRMDMITQHDDKVIYLYKKFDRLLINERK